MTVTDRISVPPLLPPCSSAKSWREVANSAGKKPAARTQRKRENSPSLPLERLLRFFGVVFEPLAGEGLTVTKSSGWKRWGFEETLIDFLDGEKVAPLRFRRRSSERSWSSTSFQKSEPSERCTLQGSALTQGRPRARTKHMKQCFVILWRWCVQLGGSGESWRPSSTSSSKTLWRKYSRKTLKKGEEEK